jgi:hypothetical protein
MKERLAKLIDVKSLVTLLLVGTFVYRNVTQEITTEQLMTIITTVIAFYFGTQYGKKA